MTVLIMNKAAHHRALPAPHPKPGQKQKLEDHVLTPGVNEVGDEEWAEAKTLPVIQHLLEQGNDVGLEEIKPAGKKKLASNLSDLKEGEQLKVVKETNDLELLAKWRENATGPVAKAIDAQVELLTKEPGKK